MDQEAIIKSEKTAWIFFNKYILEEEHQHQPQQ